MRKVFSVFAVLIIMLTAGCEKQKKLQDAPPPAPESFTADIKVVLGKTEMTAAFTQNSAEDFVVDFIAPEALSPLSLEYKNGECTVRYNTLKFETDINRFPQAEIGAILTHALSDSVQGLEVKTTYSDGIWTYNGTGERGNFILTRDGETGAWLEFSANGADLHITFANFVQK